MAEIPTPDFAVPYLSPYQHTSWALVHAFMLRHRAQINASPMIQTYAAPMQVKTMAEVQPMAPKKGA